MSPPFSADWLSECRRASSANGSPFFTRASRSSAFFLIAGNSSGVLPCVGDQDLRQPHAVGAHELVGVFLEVLLDVGAGHDDLALDLLSQHGLRQHGVAHLRHQVFHGLPGLLEHPVLELVDRRDLVLPHDLVALPQYLRLDVDREILAFLHQQPLIDQIAEDALFALLENLLLLFLAQVLAGDFGCGSRSARARIPSG